MKRTGHAANGHCSHPPVVPLRRPSDGAESALRAMLRAPVTGIFITERAERQFTEAEDLQCSSSCTPRNPLPSTLPVPDQHDRRPDQLVDAIDERDEVPLAHGAACVLPRGMAPQTVTQPGPGPRSHRDQPGHREPSRTPAADGDGRSHPAPAPGPSPRRPAGETCFVLEADVAPAGRPGPLPPPRSPPSTR